MREIKDCWDLCLCIVDRFEQAEAEWRELLSKASSDEEIDALNCPPIFIIDAVDLYIKMSNKNHIEYIEDLKFMKEYLVSIIESSKEEAGASATLA